MIDILIGTIMVSLIAAVVGVVIAISSKLFYVEPDKRIEEIYDLLPHFNCGACGHPGCMPMAEALIGQDSKVDQCKPASKEQKEVLKGKLVELDLL